MEIEGLDYNTQREKLLMPEYGREVQKMVDLAISLPTKSERQRCAATIIRIMDRMYPQNRQLADHEQKLWDHLALMSQFKLDIDYPYDVAQAATIATKPEPMSYPMSNIPVRHYGKLMGEIFQQLKTMPEGKERDELTRQTANQMKRDLVLWGHGSIDDEKVADDLARYTDGKIQLDLNTFSFERFVPADEMVATGKKKKGKR